MNQLVEKLQLEKPGFRMEMKVVCSKYPESFESCLNECLADGWKIYEPMRVETISRYPSSKESHFIIMLWRCTNGR